MIFEPPEFSGGFFIIPNKKRGRCLIPYTLNPIP